SGEGIVKALALGADFVMLGRPFLYASGADGQRGVFRLVDMLKNEMLLALAQIGCTDVSHLDQNVLV
ncbi:MAG: alpha-hydroxy-acid oxidizing protein, partial [Pseudomonadota bacterium]|nr:alpha-hydroxy-acid oxidizing protein [Pseudomonadota bacterium]